MSILIKGMEMPTNCYFCPFCDYVSGRCDAVKGNPYTPESRYEKRADFCPLVPVPTHGRLIDADALLRHCVDLPREGGYMPVVYKSYITNAPTIIEAEGEE